MTATYSGIDPELRRLSRAGAFGVDEHVGNTPLIRLRHLLAMGYDGWHSHAQDEVFIDDDAFGTAPTCVQI